MGYIAAALAAAWLILRGGPGGGETTDEQPRAVDGGPRFDAQSLERLRQARSGSELVGSVRVDRFAPAAIDFSHLQIEGVADATQASWQESETIAAGDTSGSNDADEPTEGDLLFPFVPTG